MADIEHYPILPLHLASLPDRQKIQTERNRHSFGSVLTNELSKTPVKLTKHARERMESRNIHISADEWNQIHAKMQEAEKKGVHDSLVLTPEAALVVNAPNNTVITAMNLSEAKSHIFTNINGTILLNH